MRPDRLAIPPSHAGAYAHCERTAREHYENFPVASRLLPKAVRPHIAAIYAFARRADDFADEGGLEPEHRLRLLDDWGRRLRTAAAGGPTREAGTEPRAFKDDGLVFDAVANRSFAACTRILKPHGRYVTTLPGRGILFWSAMLQVAGLAGYGKRARIVLARPNGDDLELLRGWADQGRLRAVIERVYAPEEVQEAHAKSEAGHAHGKIVLRMA